MRHETDYTPPPPTRGGAPKETILFGVGLVSRVEIVQYIAAGIMMFAGGIAIGLALRNDEAYWYVGGALFFACAVLLVIKDQVTRKSPT